MRIAAILALAVGCASAPPVSDAPVGPAPPAVPASPPVAPVAAAPAPAAATEPSPVAATSPEPSCEPLTVAVPEVPMGKDDVAVPAIVRPELLARFFEQAARVLRGTARDHVRIAVYGDSNLTMDFMTGRLRRALQQRYGDAGHGFVALGKPWSHYIHMDVRHDVRSGYEAYSVTTNTKGDGAYGLAGITVESQHVGATTWVETATDESPIGHKASSFDLFYLKLPNYGKFDIKADGQLVRTVDTDGERALAVEHFELPDGPHRIEIVDADPERHVRLFGITLERAQPGFIVDSFGVGAMNSRAQAAQDPLINKPMLQHRKYDLIVFATGANDVFTMAEVPGHLDKIIGYHREALPDTPILFLTPADRGKDRSFKPTIAAVEQRKELAEKYGAALWDLWSAMGGKDSMRRFKERGMAKPDHIHVNYEGGAYLADRLFHALWTSLAEHAAAQPSLGCGPTSAPDREAAK